MYKLVAISILLAISHFSTAQYYTGYYVSDPQVHSFDHFKIKQEKNDSKLEGNLLVHAFIERQEIWSQTASYVEDDSEKSRLIELYQHGEEIVSVHELKFMWDGNEWEYILLGYMGDDKHRHFIIIEEVFNDETETRLLDFNRFDWVKAHHLTTAQRN